MNALLIDDEQKCHDVLSDLLKKGHPEINIQAHAYSVAEGLECIKKYQPDLLFLDIKMPDGTGFDLLQQAKSILNFQVVFVSAHNQQYAETAIRFEALDALDKPVNTLRLRNVLLRAKINQLEVRVSTLENMLKTILCAQENKLPETIKIYVDEQKYALPTEHIIRLEADGNYTKFVVENEPKKSYLVTGLLRNFEAALKPFPAFMRVHRSHLIHLKQVARIERGERFRTLMKNGDEVRVSRSYRTALLDRFDDFF